MDGNADGQGGGGAAGGGQQGRPTGMDAVRDHITANKVTFALFCTRVAQVLFAIGFILPLFG